VPERLVDLWNNEGLGFVVYKCEMTFKEGARFGDVLEIRTTPSAESKFRLSFDQQVWRKGGAKPLVLGKVDMVCVDRSNKMVELPPQIIKDLEEKYGMKV
jgi:acyl-CoA thioester hydrolase